MKLVEASVRAEQVISPFDLDLEYALFETSIGHLSICWTNRGVYSVRFPDEDAHDYWRSRKAVMSRLSGQAQLAAAEITAHLDGRLSDFRTVTLDLEGVTEFCRRVYDSTRTVPPGRTVSYGDLADRLGSRRWARAVGRALAANRHPIIVPCHRVVAKDGNLTGFTAPGGCDLKRRLLALEGGLADVLKLERGSAG